MVNFSNMNLLNFNNSYMNYNPLNMLFGNNINIGGWGYNSLFTNCDGTPNYSAQAGFAVGEALLNCGIAALSHSLNNKKENSEESIQDRIQGYMDDIDTNFNKLGISSASELDNVKPAENFTNAVNNAKAEVEKYQKQLNEFVKPEQANYSDANEYNKALSEYNKNISETEKNLKKAQEDLKKAQEALEKEETNIKSIVDETKVLLNKLKNAQDAYNEKRLNDCDDRTFSRVSDKEYNTKFKKNKDNTQTAELAEGAEFSRKDLKRAIFKYRNATNEKDKELYKKQFMAIYEHLNKTDSDELTSEMKEAWKILSQ